MQGDFGAGGCGKQVDLCIRVGVFEGMYDGEREDQVAYEVQANDQDALRVKALWFERGIVLAQSCQPEQASDDAHEEVYAGAQYAFAGAYACFAQFLVWARREWVTVVVEIVLLLFFCV